MEWVTMLGFNTRRFLQLRTDKLSASVDSLLLPKLHNMQR